MKTVNAHSVNVVMLFYCTNCGWKKKEEKNVTIPGLRNYWCMCPNCHHTLNKKWIKGEKK